MSKVKNKLLLEQLLGPIEMNGHAAVGLSLADRKEASDDIVRKAIKELKKYGHTTPYQSGYTIDEIEEDFKSELEASELEEKLKNKKLKLEKQRQKSQEKLNEIDQKIQKIDETTDNNSKPEVTENVEEPETKVEKVTEEKEENPLEAIEKENEKKKSIEEEFKEFEVNVNPLDQMISDAIDEKISEIPEDTKVRVEEVKPVEKKTSTAEKIEKALDNVEINDFEINEVKKSDEPEKTTFEKLVDDAKAQLKRGKELINENKVAEQRVKAAEAYKRQQFAQLVKMIPIFYEDSKNYEQDINDKKHKLEMDMMFIKDRIVENDEMLSDMNGHVNVPKKLINRQEKVKARI